MFKDYFSTVPLLEQLTLSKFMSLGHWERHIRRMRTIYKKKHDALVSCIENHFGSRAVIIGQGAGLHVVVQFQKNTLSEADLIGQAGKHGIRLFPFSGTSILDEPSPLHMMLGFGGLSLAEIAQGIAILSQVCHPD